MSESRWSPAARMCSSLASCADWRRPACLDLEQLGEAEDGVERRPQLVAHARQKLRLGLDLALGERRLLARDLGVLALGDVPVDADAARRPAGIVEHRGRARREPAIAAVGQADAELVGHRQQRRRSIRRPLEDERHVVGMDERHPLLAARRGLAQREAAQVEHLLIPAPAAGGVGLPRADAGVAGDERGTLAGFAQRIERARGARSRPWRRRGRGAGRWCRDRRLPA